MRKEEKTLQIRHSSLVYTFYGQTRYLIATKEFSLGVLPLCRKPKDIEETIFVVLNICILAV